MNHTFWKKAWQLLDADESYIRASSVRVIGIILEKNELRQIFLQDFSLVYFIEFASFVTRFYKAFRNMKILKAMDIMRSVFQCLTATTRLRH